MNFERVMEYRGYLACLSFPLDRQLLKGKPEILLEIPHSEIEETEETKQEDIAKTESEQIKIEGEKMKSLETLEEEEQRLK